MYVRAHRSFNRIGRRVETVLYSRKYKYKEIKNKPIKIILLFFFNCLLKVKTLIIPIYDRTTIYQGKIT
jgi:hypothetical protein